MAPITWEIDLTGFRFPNKLPPKRANFRIVVDLRYVTKRGDHTTEHAVLPGLDRWWECDPDRNERLEFVRGPDHGRFVASETRIPYGLYRQVASGPGLDQAQRIRRQVPGEAPLLLLAGWRSGER